MAKRFGGLRYSRSAMAVAVIVGLSTLALPAEVRGDGQDRGNGGVFFMGIYEVQILDSYNNDTYLDGQAGAIYKQRPPLVNACRKPGEWQSFDIVFRAPRFDEKGNLLRPCY